MNSDPVLIVDDDVDMEPVLILDEDDENTVLTASTVVSIDLDEETPGVETVQNSFAKINKNTEAAFVNNLKNNSLMDKIVKRCLNMENATGMPRVVNKTLLPLYRDTNNRFKESEGFRELLKKTYKLLMKDPDHKFLHVKRLCEELKSGGLGRKVPFVTLATNLKNNGAEWKPKEITSSSREINHNDLQNVRNVQVKQRSQYTKKKIKLRRSKRNAKQTNKQGNQVKNNITSSSVSNSEKEKTYIIDLDDSDTGSAKSDLENPENENGQNDVIIVEETEPTNQINYKLSQEQQTQEAAEEDTNKENNDKNLQSSGKEMDYDLLIPTNVCPLEVLPIEYDPETTDQRTQDQNPNYKSLELINILERQIAYNKKMIDKLEEEEVTTESPYSSPYYLCSKYKEDIVKCYKEICKLKGECVDIVKRCEIRLFVADGHRPEPAKRLEKFLNSTIDTTGAVEFPNFSEVLKCVIESNVYDNLRWSRPQVVKEAIALFRQCGEALRKRRQKREYHDLMSLVRDKEQTDDPAEKDPVLLAKLEGNKLIAKKKEEEVLDRYVRMEKDASVAGTRIQDIAEFESDKDSSYSESEDEQNITTPNNISTPTVNNQPETGESSRSKISLDLLQTSNTILTFAPNNSNSNITQNGETYYAVGDNLVVNSGVPPVTQNQMLFNLVAMPAAPLYFVQNTNTNQNNLLTVLPINTTFSTLTTVPNDPESLECNEPDKRDKIYSNLNSAVSETVTSFNTATSQSLVNEPSNVIDIQDNVSYTTNGLELNCDPSIISKEIIKEEIDNEEIVKDEIIKEEREPVDIQSMLDELGDGFVSQIYDVEDPFLVIEISSESSTDDEEL